MKGHSREGPLLYRPKLKLLCTLGYGLTINLKCSCGKTIRCIPHNGPRLQRYLGFLFSLNEVAPVASFFQRFFEDCSQFRYILFREKSILANAVNDTLLDRHPDSACRNDLFRGARGCGRADTSRTVCSLSASASRDSESTVNVNASSLNVKKLLFKSLLLLRC